MKSKLSHSILLVLIVAAALSTGCQRSLVNGQLPVADFLASSDDSIEMLYGIGRMSERNGKTAKAIEAYQSVLAAQPDHANAMHRMGVIKAKQGLINESITWMEKASQQETPSAELIGDMGYVLYLDNDLSAAKMMLEKGLQEKPNDERMTNNLALVTGAMQQYNESMDLFRQHGTEAEALAAIAYVQAQGGHVDAARTNYMKSLELDGTLKIAANALIQLEQNDSNADGSLRQGQQIEMPAPVQFAAYHGNETSNSGQQPVASNKIAPRHIDNMVVMASTQSRIAQQQSGSEVILEQPRVVRLATEAVEAAPLPMKPPVVKPKPITNSESIAVVKGRLRGPARTAIGRKTRFQLFVENPTSESASNIEVVLDLDGAMEIASASHEAWLNEDANAVAWTLNTLAAGEVETIEFDAVSNVSGMQTHRLTIKVNGQPVGELSLDTRVE